MKNADMPINGFMKQAGDTAIRDGGLTKREYFAAMAMQSFMSDRDGVRSLAEESGWEANRAVASVSIQLADALLAELERTS